jgi:hypothetical protein
VDWKKRGTLCRLGIHRDVNPPQAANLPTPVAMLLCCRMYIPDLPTYLVFYLETTHGSSIDPPTTDDDGSNDNDNDNYTLYLEEP